MGSFLAIFLLFLRIGLTAFGGPAAHIALFHHEFVQRRKWLSDEEFLDLLGATNLIPGPNSTEMAVHIGFRRAGWCGWLAGGLGFILPAMILVLILSWAYVEWGMLPQAQGVLYGIQPVILAILLQALWTLSTKALKTPGRIATSLAVFLLYFLGWNEIALLFGAGMIYLLLTVKRRRGVSALVTALSMGSGSALAGGVPFNPTLLFLTFLKIGAVLYGSGYVLLAFLRRDFVLRLGWLSDRQLLDAIAIGQITPGPLFTSATFIGYLLGGIPTALLATLGIFLPAFVFVALSIPLLPRMRRSAWTSRLFDGINAASLGLMAAVTLQIAFSSLIDLGSILIATVSFLLLIRYTLNSTWLILAGGLVGLILSSLL